jgi:16S rRNA processing protein RimM
MSDKQSQATSPSSQEWRLVGKVKDAHALKGEISVLIFSGDTSWFKKLKQVLIGEKNFVVERAKPNNVGLILALTGITDRNQAEELKGKTFSIPAELLISAKGEVIYLSEILHFLLIANGVEIAPIHGFSSNGAQDLLLVSHHGFEVAIPFVADFIESIDHQKRCIFMNLPEGLLEVESSSKS